MEDISSTEITIVGIGASAGGLEALQDFFRNLSTQTNMAFVIIQHLSPTHKSLMGELLSRCTEIPVLTVNAPTRVEKNTIYLLPPNKHLILNNNVLLLVERAPKLRLNLPIDVFFDSLAENSGENSVAIILSGTGTDGSRGIRKIKKAGGLVLIQSPESAQFDGMPNASLILGIEDKIQDPRSLALELSRIANDVVLDKSNLFEEELKEGANFDRFLELMYKKKEVDFRIYRRSILMRRIKKNMMLNNVFSLDAYLDVLSNNDNEINKLFTDFLIGVTHFFRDEDSFKILQTKIIPQLFSQIPSDEELRIWIVGCSTGEEAYSIAILLEEYKEIQGITTDYKIFASDLNDQAIDFASKGMYNENSTAKLNDRFLEKYFINVTNRFLIKEKIRKKIVFVVHDVTRDPPFIRVNLVTCRNLLIYIEHAAQQRILTKFHFALNYGGYLFLGPSESIGELKSAFECIDIKWNLYKSVRKEKLIHRSISPKKTKLVPSVSKRKVYYSEHVEKKQYMDVFERDYFSEVLTREFAPMCIIVNQNLDVLHLHGDTDVLLYFPANINNLNLKDMMAKEETLVFRNAVRKLGISDEKLMYKDIAFKKRDKLYIINLSFKNVQVENSKTPLILVEVYVKGETESASEIEINYEEFRDERLETLEFELREAKSKTQSLVTQLRKTNQELQVANEELIASNEELQSTNEELQSVSEELYTVNTELQAKITELTMVNNDIDNLLESTQIGTIFLDKELRIRKFTPAVSQQFEVVETDIGRPISNFANKFSYQNITQELGEVLNDKGPIEREITTVNNKHFLMRILPYHATNNEINGVVVTFVNIGEIVQARQELLQFNKVLEEKVNNRTVELQKTNTELETANSYLDSFVYATAHDLRAPFIHLKSFSELLDKVEGIDEKEEIIEKMKVAINRFGTTLNGLVNIVEFHKNSERLIEKVEFRKILNEVKKNLSNELNEIDVTFTEQFHVKSIFYIEAFVRSIFENLLSNAIKYRNPKRKLNVSITIIDKDEFVELTFSDNGSGIDLKKYGDKIFKPFKRFSKNIDGVGIGLSLVKQAVSVNGGDIKVKSIPEKGATFILMLRKYSDE